MIWGPEQNSLLPGTEKVIVFWIGDQNSHNILKPNPNLEQDSNSLQFFEGSEQ